VPQSTVELSGASQPSSSVVLQSPHPGAQTSTAHIAPKHVGVP
jgi:hypothetical protein